MHHSAVFNVQRRKKETGGHLIARMAVSGIFFSSEIQYFKFYYGDANPRFCLCRFFKDEIRYFATTFVKHVILGSFHA